MRRSAALLLLFGLACTKETPPTSPFPFPATKSSLYSTNAATTTAFKAAAVSDPCAGRVQDKLPRSQPNLPLPTLRVQYHDPVFSTKITRFTDASPSEGENAVIKPLYSTIPAWNSDESLLMVWHRGRGGAAWELYQGDAPYNYVKSLHLTSPSDVELVVWDPVYSNVLWYPSNYNGTTILYVHNSDTDQSYPWIDFASYGCKPGDLLWLGNNPSGPSYLHGDPLLGMQCGTYQTPRAVYWVNLHTKFVLAVADSSSRMAPEISPWGTRAYRPIYPQAVAVNGFWGARVVLPLKPEHGSVGASYGAMHSWNTVDFDTPNSPGNLIRWDLETGARKVVIGTANGWPYPPGTTHLSAISGAIGWVAVSSVGAPDQIGKVPLHGEIYFAQTDTGQVCRVAHHHSLAGEGPWGYWGEPHVTISRKGNRAVFGSDWGGGATINSYVLDLR